MPYGETLAWPAGQALGKNSAKNIFTTNS